MNRLTNCMTVPRPAGRPPRGLQLCLAALLALLPAAEVAAQTTGRQVKLRLLAFDSQTVPADCHAFDPAATPARPGVPAPVKGYLNHERTDLSLLGNTLVFAGSPKPEDAKDPAHQLATVSLPPKGGFFLLIFLPDGTGKFRVISTDDSVGGFPLGSYRVLNLSHQPVRLTLETTDYDFKPGEVGLIADPPVQANQHSAMRALALADGNWRRIGSGLWPHPGTKRSIQVFFDNPQTKQTELRGFRDIAPP